MKKFVSILGSLTLAASFGVAVTACGNSSNNNKDGGTVDLSTPPDLTTPPPDMTPVVTGAETGEPCTGPSDCRKGNGPNQSAQCLKSEKNALGETVTYTNGYCSSACRTSKTDPSSGLNPDCPSENATCEDLGSGTGRCRVICNDATTDCRFDEGYVCATSTQYAAICTPKTASWCDPTDAMSCDSMNTSDNTFSCTSYSPDDSNGECTLTCDPITQGCPDYFIGTTAIPQACIAGVSGQPPKFDTVATCVGAGQGEDGDTCHYLNDCVPGSVCFSGVCSPYCKLAAAGSADAGTADGGTADEGKDCPSGWSCVTPDGKAATAGALGVCKQN